LFNKNSLPVLNSPNTNNTTNVSAANPSSDQQTIEQMQQLITQYQAREKQYQTELNDAAQRLNQANQQLNQYSQMMDSVQQLLNELQRRGIITITNDGQILIPNNGSN
jgi:DNA integrity scanning protein DisA with diadenylate cyclase activity